MKDGQDNGGAFADFVVVKVAAIVACRAGRRCKTAWRGQADASEHRTRRELELHFAADRLAQVHTAVPQVDIPGKNVIAALAYDVGLVVVGISGFDVLRRQREKTEAIGRRAPVAVQPHLPKLDHDRVTRPGALDVKGARQRIAAFGSLLATVILAARIQRLGDNDIAGFDPLENRVGVSEGAVVAVRDDLTGLSKQRHGSENREEDVSTHSDRKSTRLNSSHVSESRMPS